MNVIVRKIIDATHYSLQGILSLFHTELSFRLELLAMIILMPIIYMMDVEFHVKLLLIALAWLVLIVEALNAAIEAVINRISLDHHLLSKKAKDIGSAAVFLTISLNVITWLLILLN